MVRTLYTTILVALTIAAQAQQKTTLKGIVADSSSKELLEMATVTVQDNRDSSLITYTLTNKKGEFQLSGIPADKHIRLLISYTGYRTFIKTMGTDRQADQGTIHLAPSATELNTVVIEGDRPPVSIRKDTIEFNAASFKTRPNAVVEDLLKKLPGLDIDDEGKITVNGKKVSRILVDGREFFANDPKLATKNLPSSIIDKVQVVDTKTRQEAKMDVQKDGEDKTLNLTLKADKKRGLFGRVSAGAATDDGYDLSGMINAFDGARQISVLGSSNNLNKMGFSSGEIMSVASGPNGPASINVSANGLAVNGISFGGGGDGIKTASMAGYNYNDKWNKTDVNNSYFFNNVDSRSSTQTRREYLNADGHLFSNSDRSGFNRNANHRLNFMFDIDLDSTLTLNLTPSYDYTKNTGNNTGMETTSQEDGSLVNTNETNNRIVSTNQNFSNSLGLTKILNKKGRSLAFQFVNTNGTFNSEAYNINNVDYYENDVITESRNVNQKTISDNTTANYKASITYNEPLSKTLRLTMGYGYTYNSSTSDRLTYNYDAGTKDYTDLDDVYTNKFRTYNTSQSPNIGLSYNGKQLTGNFGATLFINVLDNYSFTTNTTLRQYQNNFAPNSRLNYRLKNNGNITLAYNAYMQQPTLDQLQPVPDNTNTLNQRIGNPDLKPSFQQSIQLNYSKFSMNGIGIFSGITYAPVLNRISTASFINSKGERTTQAINVDGTYNITANFTMSLMKKTSGFQYRISGGGFVNGGRNISFSNSGNAAGDTTLYRNVAINVSYAPYVMFLYAYKDWLDVSLNYRPSYTDARYKPNNISQGSFIAHRASLGTSLYWPKNFTWDNDVNYNYNSRIAPGFKKGVMLWNMSLGYDFLKNKSLQIKASAFDLLHQNTSVRRTVNELYIEDTQTNIVDQYFMLTLSWNFSRFGAKPKMGNRRIDGGRMLMF